MATSSKCSKSSCGSSCSSSKKQKLAAVSKSMTKNELLSEIATSTGLNRKQVSSVFDELGILIERHVKKNAVGQFTLPGLLKISTKKVAARKAQKGVPNPFKPGELMDIPARPATTRIKVTALKKLKEMAQN